MKIVAVLWVCPHCGEYYGATSAGDLRIQFNTDVKGAPTFPRSRCPSCGDERKPHQVEIEIPGPQ